MANKRSHEEYIEKLSKIRPEIVALELYNGATTKILHKCNDCKEELLIAPSKLFKGSHICDFKKRTNHQQYLLDRNERKYCVYVHIFPHDPVKRYIGITGNKRPERRWKNGNGYPHNKYFNNAVNKYGWENVKSEILFKNLTEAEAKAKEVELVAKYKSSDRKYGYNITFGGDKMTHLKGKLSPLFGIPKSEEIRKKISISNKGKLKGENSPFAKKVMNIDTGEIFTSVTYASEKCKIEVSSISKCCRGESLTSGGYQWKYIDVHNEIKDNKPVYQYDINNGYLLRKFDSVFEAANVYNLNKELLTNRCNGIHHLFNFIWMYDSFEVIPAELFKKIRWSITNVNTTTKVINITTGEIFDSIIEASNKFNCCKSAISNVCRGKSKTSMGYRWAYYDPSIHGEIQMAS